LFAILKFIDGKPIAMVDAASYILASLSGYDFQYSGVGIGSVGAIAQFELNQAP
jgi:hypothetical protein